jgi:hypothetical protein
MAIEKHGVSNILPEDVLGMKVGSKKELRGLSLPKEQVVIRGLKC